MDLEPSTFMTQALIFTLAILTSVSAHAERLAVGSYQAPFSTIQLQPLPKTPALRDLFACAQSLSPRNLQVAGKRSFWEISMSDQREQSAVSAVNVLIHKNRIPLLYTVTSGKIVRNRVHREIPETPEPQSGWTVLARADYTLASTEEIQNSPSLTGQEAQDFIEQLNSLIEQRLEELPALIEARYEARHGLLFDQNSLAPFVVKKTDMIAELHEGFLKDREILEIRNAVCTCEPFFKKSTSQIVERLTSRQSKVNVWLEDEYTSRNIYKSDLTCS